MARKRRSRPTSPRGGSGTPRKLSAAYERRNARARALGYQSYYDYRAHNHGKAPPGAARPSGETLARLRGHRSAADLTRAVRTGSLVSVLGHSERDPVSGTYKWVDIVVVDPRGRERSYRLRGSQLEQAKLRRLVADLEERGAVLSPTPSLDLRRAA